MCNGTSTGPDIPLFQYFQNQWHLLDKSNYKCYEDTIGSTPEYQTPKRDMFQFLRHVPNEGQHPREDYSEQ